MAEYDMQQIYLSLIRECQYCYVAIKLDYINSSWQSVKRIIAGLAKLMNLAGNVYDEAEVLSFAKGFTGILSEMNDSQLGRDLCRVVDTLEDLMIWLSDKLGRTSFIDQIDYLDRNLKALEKTGYPAFIITM